MTSKHFSSSLFLSSLLSSSMAFSRHCRLLLPFLYMFIMLINRQVNSADEEDNLLQGINSYRASLNLTALTKNDDAACFAGQISDQFKDQPCTNTTGANTVPGTETQLSNYPDLLSHCHLNISNTRDGIIMPACVPNLVPSLVLSNFTKSQYSNYLNDSTYSGAGIGSDGNWIVVVLSTNASSGSFETATSASFVSEPLLISHLLIFLMGCFLV